MENISFEGRVAIITGGARGLGRSYAELLGRRGAQLVLNDFGGGIDGRELAGEPLETAAEELRGQGIRVEAVFGDVGQVATPEAMVGKAIEAYGRVDVLINNAGAHRTETRLGRLNFDDMMYSVQSHLGGAAALINQAWPHMVEQGYGRIVNVASGAVFGAPNLIYGAAKGGVFTLTRSVQTAVAATGADIASNAVMPEAWTRMTENGLVGAMREKVSTYYTADRVGQFVSLLASQECPWRGSWFEVGDGNVSRVLLGATQGYRPGDEELSPELYLLHAADIDNLDGLVFPQNIGELFAINDVR